MDKARPANRKKHRGSKKQRSETVEQRANRIVSNIRKLAQSIAWQQGAYQSDNAVEAVTIQLTVPVAGDGLISDPVENLVSSLKKQVQLAMKSSGTLQPGHIYCFQCENSDCKHATPSLDDETFAGYTPTGKPTWQRFTNLCIENGESRVDQLWGDAPEIIALVQSADELKGDLLPGFGHEDVTFNVLGQVVVGLLPRDLKPGRSNAERVALTLQFIETRSPRQSQRIRLNMIGLTMEQVAFAAADGDARGPAESLRRTLRTTRQKLDALSRRMFLAQQSGTESDSEPQVDAMLTRLKGDVERVFRPVRRRTKHAQKRHVGGKRPTGMAIEDALRASNSRMYEDAHHKTVVVLGKRGRAHVFTPTAGHVTSLQLKPGELERKTKSGRWRTLAGDDVTSFKSALATVANT